MKLYICLLMLALPVFSVQAEVPPDLRIAVVVPLSSAIGEVAQEALNGAALGVREGLSRLKSWQNQHGNKKINVKLDFWDDKANPTTAEMVAKNIVNRRQYHAVVGGINSGTAIPVAKIFEQAGLINVALGASNPALTLVGHQWAFRMSMDDDQLARSTYVALVHRLRDTPALFVHDDTTYGGLTAKGFASAHRSLTDQLGELHNLGFSGDTNLSAARNIEGSEAVMYVGGMDLFAINVVRRLRKDVQWTIVGGRRYLLCPHGEGNCTPGHALDLCQSGAQRHCPGHEHVV